VRFAEVDGNIDLGTDSGRLAARILIAVAKAEQERKAERQKLAFEQAAINGKRFTGCPRPFGYQDDHVTAHPVEGPAVAEACTALLGGGTISGVRREWIKLGLTPPQQARRGATEWNRTSIRMILLNPRIADLAISSGGWSRRVKIRSGARHGGLGPLPRPHRGLCRRAGGGTVGAGCL
jgi:site-specific DNA recombinase